MSVTEPVLPPGSPSHDLRAIAYHEAGHVVVGTALGLEVLSTDIERDGEGGRGHTHFANSASRDRDFVERVVTTFMAGFAAEERLGVPDPDGSGFDVDLTLREWLKHLEPNPAERPRRADEFYERAKAELARPQAWRAVESIAAALLAARRVDGATARRVIRSSSEHDGERHDA